MARCVVCGVRCVWGGSDACRVLIEPLSNRNALRCLLKWTNSLESLGVKGGCSPSSLWFPKEEQISWMNLTFIVSTIVSPSLNAISNVHVHSPELLSFSHLFIYLFILLLRLTKLKTQMSSHGSTYPQHLRELIADCQGLKWLSVAYLPWQGINS